MPRYVMLLNYTDKGVAGLQQSPDRADAFRALVAKHGAKVESQFWTMGAYDGVVTLSATSDEAMAALALGLAQHGSVRSTTLRAFDEAEFKGILAKF